MQFKLFFFQNNEKIINYYKNMVIQLIEKH